MTEYGTILPDDEHNRRLAANVRPPAYRNPEPAERYNLVVLGAGTAGLVKEARGGPARRGLDAFRCANKCRFKASR